MSAALELIISNTDFCNENRSLQNRRLCDFFLKQIICFERETLNREVSTIFT